MKDSNGCGGPLDVAFVDSMRAAVMPAAGAATPAAARARRAGNRATPIMVPTFIYAISSVYALHKARR